MASGEKTEFVLFFMDSCNFCKKMLPQLKQKPDLLKKFNLVDINKVPQLPDEVDEVPCIYDGKSIHKGTDSFKWLAEKFSEYLDSAYDSLNYSFLEGQDEQVFNNYSLLDQKNGSFGMGDSPADKSDPTRMAVMNDNTNKNRSLESIIAARGLENVLRNNH